MEVPDVFTGGDGVRVFQPAAYSDAVDYNCGGGVYIFLEPACDGAYPAGGAEGYSGGNDSDGGIQGLAAGNSGRGHDRLSAATAMQSGRAGVLFCGVFTKASGGAVFRGSCLCADCAGGSCGAPFSELESFVYALEYFQHPQLRVAHDAASVSDHLHG